MNAKDEFLKAILANLEMYNWDEFMNLSYNLLVSFPQDAIDHNVDKIAKVENIDKMIKHFENREEFEKCATLQELREVIDKNC
jgi:hypothetical protein